MDKDRDLITKLRYWDRVLELLCEEDLISDGVLEQFRQDFKDIL